MPTPGVVEPLNVVKDICTSFSTGIHINSQPTTIRDLARQLSNLRKSSCDRRIANPVKFDFRGNTWAGAGHSHEMRDEFLCAGGQGAVPKRLIPSTEVG